MVTVVIPTFNRASTLERAIRSVLNQTMTDIELIIVDDGSTDNTKEVVDSICDNRIRYVRLSHNSGGGTARNRGIGEAKGEFIAFQDSDDEWLPNKLETQLTVMKNSGAGACFCSKKQFSVDGQSFKITHEDLSEGIVPNALLYRKSRVSTQTLIAKREVFDKALFDVNVLKAQDYEWTIRACEYCKFYFVAQPLVNQYLQDDSITIKGKDRIVEIRMCEYFYKKFRPQFRKNPELEMGLLGRMIDHKLSAGTKSVWKDCLRMYVLCKEKRYLKQSIRSLIRFKAK